MGRLISIVIVIIDIIVILDVLRSNKDTEKKILWIIAIVFLPILGPILWYVTAKK
jgi:hypothetical protein